MTDRNRYTGHKAPVMMPDVLTQGAPNARAISYIVPSPLDAMLGAGGQIAPPLPLAPEVLTIEDKRRPVEVYLKEVPRGIVFSGRIGLDAHPHIYLQLHSCAVQIDTEFYHMTTAYHDVKVYDYQVLRARLVIE